MLADKSIRRDKKYSLPRRILLAVRKRAATKYRETLNSEIREKIKNGENISELLDKDIYDYIVKNGLYVE